MEHEKGNLGPKTTLLHVDAHLDDTWDGAVVEGLREMTSTSDYLEVAGKLEIDNFIWAGFAAQLVDHIVYVCPTDVDKSDPFDLSDWNLDGEQLKPIKELLKLKPYQGSRFETIQQLREELADDSAIEKVLDLPGSVILDLDLDVFKLNLSDPEDQSLKPDEQIREELIYLKGLYSYDLVTVALSPAFCGGTDNCERLYQIFLEVFGLKMSDAKEW